MIIFVLLHSLPWCLVIFALCHAGFYIKMSQKIWLNSRALCVLNIYLGMKNSFFAIWLKTPIQVWNFIWKKKIWMVSTYRLLSIASKNLTSLCTLLKTARIFSLVMNSLNWKGDDQSEIRCPIWCVSWTLNRIEIEKLLFRKSIAGMSAWPALPSRNSDLIPPVNWYDAVPLNLK